MSGDDGAAADGEPHSMHLFGRMLPMQWRPKTVDGAMPPLTAAGAVAAERAP